MVLGRACEKRSMNSDMRRRTLMKITMENQAFLKRLQVQSSCYSVDRWEEDFRKKEDLMRNVMCERPFVLLLPTRELDPMRSSVSSHLNLQDYGSTDLLQRVTSANKTQRTSLSSYRMSFDKQQKPPLVRQAEILDEKRIVLYKKGKQLNDRGYYIVEISSNNDTLFIAAYDVESAESLLIQVPQKRAQEIMEKFNNSYEELASNLHVAAGKLILLNPVRTNLLSLE